MNPLIKKHYLEIKTALRKHKLVDFFCLGKYGFSPFRACQHACKYCDGRAEKYYVEGDFEQDIVIRSNLPELLEIELKKLREPGFIAIGSGVSDPYQPAEKDEQIMRRCARILAEHDFPVVVMTKSALPLRDIEIWQEVHQKNGFILAVSLTLLDDKVRQIFEPNASSVSARLELLAAFKERGMYVGVLAMPFIPYITDDLDSINRLFEKLRSLDVDYIMAAGLTLRPGQQKELFLQVIAEHFPDCLARIKNLYREERASGNCSYAYRQNLFPKVQHLLNELGIPSEIPHSIYKNKIPTYDEIHILLNQMKNLYAIKGIDVKRLNQSLNKYSEWLFAEKTYFNRRQKLSYHYLEDKLTHLLTSGEMADIIKNSKLADFIKRIVLEGRTFDHLSLKIND